MLRLASALVALALTAAAPSASLQALLQRVGDHVTRLQEELKVVICDETYRQEAQNHSQRVGRLIHAEVLFMWVPEERAWLAVRNIRDVNGDRVPDSENRIQQILSSPGTDMVARLLRLQREGARFDIGSFARTTSNPLLILQYLTPALQPHFELVDRGDERVAGAAMRHIAFSERKPAGVMLFNDRPAAVDGDVWVSERDGRAAVARAELRVGKPGNAIISVEFAHNERIDTWVPVHMRERYRDNTVCFSDYSNFRRFETRGRLVP